MKRTLTIAFVAVVLWAVFVQFIASTYFTHWLWGTPLAILGGVVIGVLLMLWILRRWIKRPYRNRGGE